MAEVVWRKKKNLWENQVLKGFLYEFLNIDEHIFVIILKIIKKNNLITNL